MGLICAHVLAHQRMLESYLYARDRFLKPGGKVGSPLPASSEACTEASHIHLLQMFPQVGRIHVAAFSDEMLHLELISKACFWMQVIGSL